MTSSSPAVVGRVPRLDGDERAPAGSAQLPGGLERRLHHCSVVLRLVYLRAQRHQAVGRTRTQELHRVVGGHRAGRRFGPSPLHQVHRRSPVAVAVEQRADDAAAQDVLERLVVFLGLPLRDRLVALGEAANAQPLRVRRTTAKAGVLRGVASLQTGFRHKDRKFNRIN